MYRLPTVCVKIPSKTTSRESYLAAYEAPLKAAVWRGQTGVPDAPNPIISPMPAGLVPEHYWHEFESIDAEYARLGRLYGARLAQFFATPDEFYARVERDLQTLAERGNALAAESMTVAPPDGVLEVVRAAGVPQDPENEKDRKHSAYVSDVAKDLVLIGMTSPAAIAAAGLVMLCKAKMVGPGLASVLIEKASEICATNAKDLVSSQKAHQALKGKMSLAE